MQDSNCSGPLQQLEQLPFTALEALLDSDSLKVCSENSAVRAVTQWLAANPHSCKRQEQQLAYKLRLVQCTPWFLTAELTCNSTWLHNVLTKQQVGLLIMGVNDCDGWEKLRQENVEPKLLNKLMFQTAKCPATNWWKAARPASSVRSIDMTLDVTPGELWREKQAVASKTVYFNGRDVRLEVELTNPELYDRANEDKSPPSKHVKEGLGDRPGEEKFILGVGIHCMDAANMPISFEGTCELVAPSGGESVIVDVDPCIVWSQEVGFGVPDMLSSCDEKCTHFCSLPEMVNKVSRYVHCDGKLHFKGTITSVL